MLASGEAWWWTSSQSSPRLTNRLVACTQAVEKPLDAVEIKQSGEGTAFRFGLGPQARLNRVRKALRPPPLHTSASRNGFTIFSTRQILAK